MNQLLQEAFERAAELPQAEQDRLARFLLAELESERQWAELFASPESEDLLERLADDALAKHREGRTPAAHAGRTVGVRFFAQRSFWDAYRDLPERVQRQARESYRFFASRPCSPQPGFQAREPEASSVLGTCEHQLPRSRCHGRG